jgi:hypothetical protein
MPRTPPKKQKDKPTGRRRFDGDLLDVEGLGAWWGQNEKQTYSQLRRGLLPHRRLAGRIVFVRSELIEFLRQLPGVTVAQAIANVAARNGEPR